MALLISGFEGLSDADFDVYREACWSNNLHNLDRMRTKARVLALAERAKAVLDDTDLVLESSSEIPSVWNGRKVQDQWAYLLRSDAARRLLTPVVARSMDLATRVKDPAEHHRHVLLSVRIDATRLEVAVRAHQHATVDLANLLGRAEADASGLEAVIAELPDGVTLAEGRPVSTAGLLANARAARAGNVDWLLVTRSFERSAAIEAGADLTDAVAESAAALAPLFRYIAWTPENDHVGVGEQLDAFAQAVEQREEANQAARDAAADEREARRREARARTEARMAELQAWKSSRRPRMPVREEQGPPPQRRPERPRTADPKPKRDAPARPRSAPAAAPAAVALVVGDACRLTRGLLAGKQGTVQSVDPKKKYYQVKVGALAVNVAFGDVAPLA